MNEELLRQLENDLTMAILKSLGRRVVSITIGGSVATGEFIDGYSDVDAVIYVKGELVKSRLSLPSLSRKYGVDIGCAVRSYDDLLHRIKNDNKSTRFVGNMTFLSFALGREKVIHGLDIRKKMPPLAQLLRRDLNAELRADYLHATNMDPGWNIFRRPPMKWAGYMISMAASLLLSKGVSPRKEDLPELLPEHFPEFRAVGCVREALRLRRTKILLRLRPGEKKRLRKMLGTFLDEYRRLLFY